MTSLPRRAESDSPSSNRIELQIGLSFDDQDRALGMDTHCICTVSGATHYGGVRAWHAVPDELRLTLTDEAAQCLGLATEVSVGLALNSDAFQQLCSGLRRILDRDGAAGG